MCTISLPGSVAWGGGPNLAVRLNVSFTPAAVGARISWIGDLVSVGTSYAYSEGTINITSPGTVSVTPGTVTVPFGGAQQFSAAINGTSTSAVNWSLNPGIGTISTTGAYTAPVPMSDQRTVTVTATSQANLAIQGPATVTLVLPSTLHLTSANLPVGTQYGATSAITADSGFVVNSGQVVTLTSAGTIMLDPGFHASPGSVFRANIDTTVH